MNMLKVFPAFMKISVFFFLSIVASHAEILRVADMEKLSDPVQRDTEVTRLANGGDEYTLIHYHFLKATQSDGKPPLHVLAAERNYKSSYISAYEYQIEKPDELFTPEKSNVRARTEPSLDPIHESVLLVFDEKGKEIRPFGGNNFINIGYLFDFDGDGILDRADSTNYGLENARNHSVEVFEIESVEAKPRTILRVIYNFHPNNADEANKWTFECFDENKDGIPEIAFGPLAGSQHEIIFRFDKATGTYSAGDLPEKPHVRVISADDNLEAIAIAGGLGYPLIEKGSSALFHEDAKKPYVFSSLKDLPIEELSAFFKGKKRRDIMDGAEGSFPDNLPKNFFGMAPKEAAMAIAEANRTPKHRAGYQLAIDDRNGTAPPASGWINYSWRSSGCYSSSSTFHAIRFGVPDPVLIVYGENSIGYVGRNPWADQPAHNARFIKLSEKESRFLADTIFWLDRIRSRSLIPESGISHFSSSGDGFASVNLFPDDGAPRHLASNTAWATTSISGNWNTEYKPETFVNLAGLLVDKGIPEILGDRWKNLKITPHSLTTPTEERLQPRVDDNARIQLAAIYSDILAINSQEPVPADILRPLCYAAGEEALVSLLPSLEKLHVSLPAPDVDEKEYQILRKRFTRDHFGAPLADDPNDHKEDHARMEALGEKLRYHPNHVLRDALESAITRLRLAADPERLKQAIIDETPEKSWALNLFRRTDPAAWAIFVSADFQKSDKSGRSIILSTLAAGHPPAVVDMIRNLKPKEKTELILDIARFHQEHEPENVAADVPEILKIVRNRKADFSLRDQAIRFLGDIEFPSEHLAEFRSLLVDEIKNPVKGKETWMGDSSATAVSALAKLPDPSQHLELILETPGISKNAFWSGFNAVAIMSADHPERERILADFISSQFIESQGFMNEIFMQVLVKDLRSLAPEILIFASFSPDTEDGDGADYSGGTFKSPVGNRYHIAREIIALWSEKDPTTLAKMWIAFVSAHPSEFDDKNSGPLRLFAEKHIMVLPATERKDALARISKQIPVPDYYGGTIAWLNSLTQ